MSYKTLEDILAAKELISPPGDTLADTLEACKISQTDLALRMNRPVKTINEIIKGKAAITPETAIQLERVLKIPGSFWLNREVNYRVELAEIAEAEKLLAEKDWLNNFPLTAMKKMKWIDFENTVISKMEAILSFLSVSNKEGFYNVYEPMLQSANHRLSLHVNKNSYAIAAWMRKGDLQVAEMKSNSYSAPVFKENLKKIKTIAATQPDNFFDLLKALCTEAGVKVVHTSCLPGAPLHGSTRWINDTPVIQLSNRYQRNDIFWFTFFHEAGHILKHGKKAIFLEGIDLDPEMISKEQEANEVAIEYLLTHEQETVVRDNFPLNKTSIDLFSKRFKTHPASIIGRFAHQNPALNQLGWNLGFFKKIEFV